MPLFSITSCFLLAAARDFPLLPQTYSLSVEANLINMNTTKLQHEAYDGDHGRVAFVVVEDGGASRHLVELASGVVVEWTERREPGGPRVAAGCAATPERRSFTVDLARHELRTSNEFLAAAPEGEAYLGVSSARGIATDLWRRAANNSYIAFEMLYEFSAAGWTFGGAAGNATVPVRATLRGTAFYGNDGAPLSAPRGFHHVYEFVNYRDRRRRSPRPCPGASRASSSPCRSACGRRGRRTPGPAPSCRGAGWRSGRRWAGSRGNSSTPGTWRRSRPPCPRSWARACPASARGARSGASSERTSTNRRYGARGSPIRWGR